MFFNVVAVYCHNVFVVYIFCYIFTCCVCNPYVRVIVCDIVCNFQFYLHVRVGVPSILQSRGLTSGGYSNFPKRGQTSGYGDGSPQWDPGAEPR